MGMHDGTRAGVWIALAGLSVACTVDGPDNEFGVPTSASASASGTPTSGGDEGSDSGSGSGSSGADADGSGTTAAVDSGESGVATSMTPPDTTGGLPGDSSTGMGDAGTEQPQSGMYSPCTVPEDCQLPSNLCLTVNMMSGFCTNTACTDPVMQCDATPGGTATPICFPVDLDGMAQDSCALGCDGGLICPTGMTCVALADGSICA